MRSRRNGTNRRLIYASLLILVFATSYLVLRAIPFGDRRPATPVRLVTGEWAPFVAADLSDNGPIVRIVTETFRRMGYEPEVSFSSWDSILNQTERIEVLGAFPFIASAERRERYAFSEPIYHFNYVLFYYRERVPHPDDLQTAADFHAHGYRFGKVAGYDVWSELANADFEFVEYPTSEAAFQALVDDEIDFLPEGRLVGEAIISSPVLTAGANEFGYLDASDNALLGAREALYLLLPKGENAQRLLDRFNKELLQVQQTTVFREAQAQLASAGSGATLVELQPSPGEDLIALVDADGQSYLAPLGSRALVVEWPAVFEEPVGALDPLAQMVTVKLLNGPLQGHVLQVDARSVRLEP